MQTEGGREEPVRLRDVHMMFDAFEHKCSYANVC